MLTATQLAAQLVADMPELEGQDVTIGDAIVLITTETAIAEWIAWHLHGDTDGDTISCCCGWTPNQAMSADEQITALDGHTAEARAALLAGIGGDAR